MKCPTCVAEGERSRVFPGGASQTCLGSMEESFYDEDGNYHAHDPNWTTRHYTCSRGHSWTVKHKTPCPMGDYP